ncbi:MAG: SprT family zinc-dependent metalloprotease [Eubacteriales bacterium]|nr:SprT family zinc-dependent metalloprotease [Eubacteriales bacterium]
MVIKDKKTGINIEFEIVRSGRKTMCVEVGRKGVIARAPWNVSDSAIVSFVASKSDWILKHLDEMEKREEKLAEGPGKLTDDELQALHDRAAAVIPSRVRFYADKIGVDYGRITIRSQKTRWGSCSAKGNLSFNCLLMLAPEKVLDSVIVHELCHRLEMNHSGRFYSHVTAAYPDYPMCAEWLKVNGPRLMRRLTG